VSIQDHFTGYLLVVAIGDALGMPREGNPVNLHLLAAQITGLFVAFAAALFLPAGTIAWPAGWAFLILFFGFVIAISLWLLRYSPGLLAERMTGAGKPDQKAWDKVFHLTAGIVFFGWLALMALDAARFRWSQMPLPLQGSGAILLLASFALFFLTFRENAFLSPAVRIQRDRGQVVVSTGPYHHVRHPMYAAFILYALGTNLLLGSWYGLLLALILIIMVAWRSVREEGTLREELPGYEAYMATVMYRLIPYLW